MVSRRKVIAFGRQRQALEDALAALATGPHHAALMEACRAIADDLDQFPGFDDKRWREYRFALKALMDLAGDGGDDDDFDAEFDALRASVGNSEES